MIEYNGVMIPIDQFLISSIILMIFLVIGIIYHIIKIIINIIALVNIDKELKEWSDESDI